MAVDSAGIEIVSIRIADSPQRDEWRIDSGRVVRIGVTAGDATQELSEVVGAVRLADGRIVIANGGSNELRIYDETGRHLASTGGDGEGPGEFRALGFIGLRGQDTVLVYDPRLRRLSRLDPGGNLLSSTPVTGLILPYISGTLSPGSIVAWEFAGEDDDRVGIYTAPVVLGLIAARGGVFQPVDTVASGEAARVRYQGRVTRAFRPFARQTDVTAARDHFFVLESPDDRSIRVYDTKADLIRIIRIQGHEPQADAAAVQSWIESWIRRYSNGSAALEAAWRHGFRETPPPENIPLFRSLEADTEGNVCAERYPLTVDAPPGYWCFTPEGRLLGRIDLPRGLVRLGPPNFDPQLEIGSDYVLGVWSDSLDVQQVRLYPLSRSARLE